MADVWLLYFITRADSLVGAFGAGLFLATILLFALKAVIAGHQAEDRHPSNESEVNQRKAWRGSLRVWTKPLVVTIVLCGVGLIITPSKNDLLFIYGGSAILEAAKSPRAAQIGDKTLNAVERWLEENTKDQVKP